MAMTNAERQRKFRAARQKKGLVRRDGWTNRDGLLAPPDETGGWASMTLKELEKGLGKLTTGYQDMEKEIFYGEIFEYAKLIEKKFTPLFERSRKDMEEAVSWEKSRKK